MSLNTLSKHIHVNCRVGSLERTWPKDSYDSLVNCRVGSLEMSAIALYPDSVVNCRVGSLEISPLSGNKI